MESLEDCEALNETSYLLQSPANAYRLMESIKELDFGKEEERELPAIRVTDSRGDIAELGRLATKNLGSSLS